jgi:GNAT superfamily N-acetyltransferase
VDRGLIAPMVASMRSQFAALIATIPGTTVIERPGFTTGVVPAVPDRSLPNSVIYADAGELEAGYDEVAIAYEDAGVRAWTVWVPPEDSLPWLEPRGHALDSRPAAMVLDLDALGEPPPAPELAPDFQRRGLASKLMHVALREARERGRRVSTLQASRTGERVYARLGYRTVGRFTMWERRAS